MILRDHVPCRLTPSGLLGAGLLTLLALPSWTETGKIYDFPSDSILTPQLPAPEAPQPSTASAENQSAS